jgi:peptidoglycan/LPS O-acetylase OafA/YrhL
MPFLYLFSEWYLNLVMVILPITVAISSLSYFIVEKPFFEMRRKYATEGDESRMHAEASTLPAAPLISAAKPL